MKAILVIDVDENADLENAIADITIKLDEWGVTPRGFKHWYSDLKAKPLPQRKCDARSITRINGPYEEAVGMEIDEYAKGFNACIDEISGGEND